MPLTSHVLNHDLRALRDEDEVSETVNDNRALALLDRIREHGERGREGLVAAREHADVRALAPIDIDRRMNGLLDLRSVKVDRRLGLHDRAGEAEYVPQNRPL